MPKPPPRPLAPPPPLLLLLSLPLAPSRLLLPLPAPSLALAPPHSTYIREIRSAPPSYAASSSSSSSVARASAAESNDGGDRSGPHPVGGGGPSDRYGDDMAAAAAASVASPSSTHARRLVLVGGGHAHVQVLRALNRRSRPPELDVTLIDERECAAYSGMIPGCVSGLYDPGSTLIRLRPLAEWAGIDFVRGRVSDVDPERRRLFLDGDGAAAGEDDAGEVGGGGGGGGGVEYDAVSFDIGSASRGIDTTPGAARYAVPTRPISDLVRRIDDAESTLRDERGRGGGGVGVGARVVVVGGGAAGIELSMAVRARWGPLFPDSGVSSLSVTLLDAGDELLPYESSRCRDALRSALSRRGVRVRHSSSVSEVTPSEVRLTDGTSVPYTHCIWAAGASSHPLADEAMRGRGVAVTDGGWIRVSPTLQSVSHPSIFAAGDCAEIEGLMGSRGGPPKAGVYAVRAGPVLIENLTRYLGFGGGDGGDLIRYEPQDDFLKLIMCGDGTALGFRFGLPLEGRWVWELKDHIDRSFVDLFDPDLLPDLSGEGGGGELDTSQYDEVREEWDVLPPGEGGALLMRTDDGVDYVRAWRVLRDMIRDDEYRDAVVAAAIESSSSRRAVEDFVDDI